MGLEITALKMRAAVDSLAASAAPIQERLRTVYMADLMALDRMGHEWDFPPHLRAEMASIHQRMTSELALRGEGTLRATTDFMTDEEAESIAEAIVELAYHVRDALAEQGDVRFPKTPE